MGLERPCRWDAQEALQRNFRFFPCTKICTSQRNLERTGFVQCEPKQEADQMQQSNVSHEKPNAQVQGRALDMAEACAGGGVPCNAQLGRCK